MISLGIPITIVSGFLGAGKTTLINQALNASELPREEIIIIENEVGQTGIDHELLLHTKERVLQLNNGCMCCSLREDLITTLASIEEVTKEWQVPLSQIIIETTGIADPQPIIQTILTTPILRNTYYIDSLLTVVDRQNCSIYQNEPVSLKQIALADRIVFALKEGDTVSNCSEIVATLTVINPLADFIYFSETAPITATDFFHLDKFQATEGLNESLATQTEVERTNEPHSRDHHHKDLHGHSHRSAVHQHDEHGFQTVLLTTECELNEAALIRWIDWLLFANQELYRFKGIIALENRELAVAVQGVNQQVSFQLTPLEKTTTKIVLIGKNLASKKIEETFNQLCITYKQ